MESGLRDWDDLSRDEGRPLGQEELHSSALCACTIEIDVCGDLKSVRGDSLRPELQGDGLCEPSDSLRGSDSAHTPRAEDRVPTKQHKSSTWINLGDERVEGPMDFGQVENVIHTAGIADDGIHFLERGVINKATSFGNNFFETLTILRIFQKGHDSHRHSLENTLKTTLLSRSLQVFG
jgi:hypothetical protein